MERAPRLKFLKKILLIDQQPGVSTAIKQALEQTGRYFIREEHHPRFALHAARWFQPDLILLDAAIAGPDRKLFATQIQADAALQDTPVVCLNALRASNQVTTVAILSGYNFFATPTKIDEILRGVQQLLFGDDSDT